MKPDDLRSLLEQVRAGNVSVDAALQGVQAAAVGDLGYAQVDLNRRQRCGFPEVIFCEGKTPNGSKAWCAGSSRPAKTVSPRASAPSRPPTSPPAFRRRNRIASAAPSGCRPAGRTAQAGVGRVVILTAGTSDLPVAQEAVVTAKALGCEVKLIADVGVAGIHRLLRHREQFAGADAIVVAAGMDGALPSVVGGLVDCPVIAVPTSIGYGAAFHGVAPLLTMLNACSANVVVVNIDSGFKGGYVAALIARRAAGRPLAPRAAVPSPT